MVHEPETFSIEAYPADQLINEWDETNPGVTIIEIVCDLGGITGGLFRITATLLDDDKTSEPISFPPLRDWPVNEVPSPR